VAAWLPVKLALWALTAHSAWLRAAPALPRQLDWLKSRAFRLNAPPQGALRWLATCSTPRSLETSCRFQLALQAVDWLIDWARLARCAGPAWIRWNVPVRESAPCRTQPRDDLQPQRGEPRAPRFAEYGPYVWCGA
jgi:hypothetical protein